MKSTLLAEKLAAQMLIAVFDTPEQFAASLPYVHADDVIVAPDCGMKYLPRNIAFGKLKAMVEGAKIVRAECSA